MSSNYSSRSVPQRHLSSRPKKASHKSIKIKSVYVPIPRPTPPATNAATAIASIPPKPMRPLTAYHIFFQLEREYVIQNMAGPDADKCIHDNKSYMCDVPRRYRSTKLSPDWYAGPGKRQKRKHRKSHGKIGFLELSQVISKRWATLESTDPETKKFVSRIAAKELAEYKAEMEVYKELTKDMTIATVASDAASAANEFSGAKIISPSSSPRHLPSFGPEDVVSSNHDGSRFLQMQYCLQPGVQPMPALSLEQDFMPDASLSIVDDEIDYSICSVSNNGHYIPSPGPSFSSNNTKLAHSDQSICDPLYELDGGFKVQHSTKNRCVSPLSSANPKNTKLAHPDEFICDPLFELDGGFNIQHPAKNRCVSPVSSLQTWIASLRMTSLAS